MKVHELFEQEERSVLSVMGKQPELKTSSFFCNNKALTSLNGSPSTVAGDFECFNNELTSLEGIASHISGNLTCYNNAYLTSLHNIHKQIKHIGREANFLELSNYFTCAWITSD
jgi:hypothetical protein